MNATDANQGRQQGFGQRSGTQAGGGTKAETESRFYVNGKPVQNIRESRPTVRQVLEASGEEIENVEVYKLSGRNDTGGERISLDERLESTTECYLRIQPKGEESERALGVSDIQQVGGQRTGGGGSNTGGGGQPRGQPSTGMGQSQRTEGPTSTQNQSNVGGSSGGIRSGGGTGGATGSGQPKTEQGGQFQRGQPAGGTNVGGGTKGMENESANPGAADLGKGGQEQKRKDQER